MKWARRMNIWKLRVSEQIQGLSSLQINTCSAHSCNPDWLILPPTQHWYSVCVCLCSLTKAMMKNPFWVCNNSSIFFVISLYSVAFFPSSWRQRVGKQTPWSPEWVELLHFQVPSSMAIKENDGSSNGSRLDVADCLCLQILVYWVWSQNIGT